jgi:hypothetical protein
MRLFGPKRGGDQAPPADVYQGLREQVLRLTPDQLGDLATDAPVLALLMETGYRESVATLVGVSDGTVSLYFSNGGGYIGLGTHPAVAEANQRWLETGAASLPDLPAILDTPLPAEGMTQFVAVTSHRGLHGVMVPEKDLGKGRHQLSRLFYAGQRVITQIRLSQGG